MRICYHIGRQFEAILVGVAWLSATLAARSWAPNLHASRQTTFHLVCFSLSLTRSKSVPAGPSKRSRWSFGPTRQRLQPMYVPVPCQ